MDTFNILTSQLTQLSQQLGPYKQAEETTTLFYESLQNVLSAQPPEYQKTLIDLFSNDLNQHETNLSVFAEHFIKTVHCSVFFREQILKYPKQIENLHALNGDALTSNAFFEKKFSAIAAHNLLDTSLEADFNKTLRLLRNHIQILIIWQDINRIYTQEKTTQTLSVLASFCIQKALNFHTQSLEKKYGQPWYDNQKQPFFIIGMGKLGAWELNLSSDIDLIFAFPNRGETQHIHEKDTKQKTLSNQAFFNKLGQHIIQSLDTVTADGFVFRVDMRLRPFGQSGALTYNFNALEDYYQTQGREWERYAMVKARIVAFTNSNTSHLEPYYFTYKHQLEALLTQFTYRKFIDYSVIEALRGLKKMIIKDIARRGLGDNIKLGKGGIREIEFITQAFQLIRGGRDISLQDNRIKVILPRLEQLNYIPEGGAHQLLSAYDFLRNTEHALQAHKDEQTQNLPDNEKDQMRLAYAMGYKNWADFYLALNQHRDFVNQEFQCVITPAEETDDTCAIDEAWEHVWEGNAQATTACEILLKNKHESPEQTLKMLNELHESSTVQALQAQAKQRLDIFIPRLLAEISNTSTPTLTLQRILKLVKSIIRRSAYLLLLIENPSALTQLVKLSEASPHIADTLATYPALLDELLDQRSLYHAPERDELESELRASMLRIEQSDLEAQMESLRYFKNAHSLKIAACEIAGTLPLMKVSDYLSRLAEAITNYTMQLCWHELVAKHGYPDAQHREKPNFIIVGYGKLGGLEMSHGSDLDLVFIHNANAHGSTDGDKPLDNQRFYMRLGQKIIHIMNTRTAGGQLYEVDMRLRPSGNSGLLVSSLATFEKYQNNNAWTWEHQALIRARAIVGDEKLKTQFNRVRTNILTQTRDPKKLANDVLEMREKMRSHLGTQQNTDSETNFHIKHDAGGIVDIEFMVQYAVLAWAHAHPALITYTDNIRILESLQAASLFSAQQATELIDAYKALRATGHRLALQHDNSVINGSLLKSEQEKVTKHWQALFGSG